MLLVVKRTVDNNKTKKINFMNEMNNFVLDSVDTPYIIVR